MQSLLERARTEIAKAREARHNNQAEQSHEDDGVPLYIVGSEPLKNPVPDCEPEYFVSENADAIKALRIKMRDAMRASHTLSLAANQLGERVRMMCYEITEDFIKEQDEEMIETYKPVVAPLRFLFNPMIRPIGTDTIVVPESSISIPHYGAYVKRARFIRVRALNFKGKMIEFTASNYEAAVIQHSVDILSGLNYMDTMLRGSLVFSKGQGEERAVTEASESLLAYKEQLMTEYGDDRAIDDFHDAEYDAQEKRFMEGLADPPMRTAPLAPTPLEKTTTRHSSELIESTRRVVQPSS